MKQIRITRAISAVLTGLMLVGCMAQSADPPLPTVESSSTTPIQTSIAPVTSTTVSEIPQPTITTSAAIATPAVTSDGTTEPIITPEVTVPSDHPTTGESTPSTSKTDPPVTDQPSTSSSATTGTTKQDPVTEPTTSSQTPTQPPKPETSITPGTSKTEETPIPTPHTHSYGAWTTVKAATCTATGTQQRTCSCGDKQIQTIAATGHKWSGWTVTKAATEQAEGEEARSCSSCKQTETRAIPKLSHTHSYSAWTTVKAATCTATGTQQRTCSCGDKQTQTIPATGHNWSKTKTVAATCTEQGYTVYTCKNCKQTRNDDYTAATGHSWGEWIVTKAATTEAEGVETRTCSKCKNTETRKIDKLPMQGATPEDCEWMAEYFLQLLNEERAKAGVQQLVTDSKMKEMAQVRADELTISFAHIRPNDQPYSTIFRDFKYGIYHDMTIHGLPESYNYYSPARCGEDIGADLFGGMGKAKEITVTDVLEAFRRSSGHWNSLMNDDFGAVGIAVSAKGSEEYPGYYEFYFEVLLSDRLY